MKILVTGSSGHLGEALMRTLAASGHEAVGLDILPSPFTARLGSIADREFVRHCLTGVTGVLHTASLHKPHVPAHRAQQFIDVNVTGTLNLLEESAAEGVRAFVFTSTTSAFGRALLPPPGAPAAWITEDVPPVPKNIYGVSKVAAENLCELVQRDTGLPCLILRTARFFPEDDDDPAARRQYPGMNLQVNEFLYRRAEIADVVGAHLLALEAAPRLGFGRYIISATTPFVPGELGELRRDAPAVLRRHSPGFEAEYRRRGWSMTPVVDRVYVNERARRDLGWRPAYDFDAVLRRLEAGEEAFSPLARLIGSKGYGTDCGSQSSDSGAGLVGSYSITSPLSSDLPVRATMKAQ